LALQILANANILLAGISLIENHAGFEKSPRAELQESLVQSFKQSLVQSFEQSSEVRLRPTSFATDDFCDR
jgi:hypothetical protein